MRFLNLLRFYLTRQCLIKCVNYRLLLVIKTLFVTIVFFPPQSRHHETRLSNQITLSIALPAVRAGIVRFYCHRRIKYHRRTSTVKLCQPTRIRLTSELLRYLGCSPRVLMNYWYTNKINDVRNIFRSIPIENTRIIQ